MSKTCSSCDWYANLKCNNIDSWWFNEIIMNTSISCDKYCQKDLKEDKKETVNHPNHYNKGIEAIEIIESWDLNFSLGNAIKYILRAPHKNNELEDLKKASWYINREIEKLEKNRNK